MAPDIPPMPSWPKLRIFLWGALWAMVGALAPVGMLLWDWLQRSERVDWGMVQHQAVVAGGLALVGFWRKHEAWLMEPPTSTQPTETGRSQAAGQ